MFCLLLAPAALGVTLAQAQTHDPDAHHKGYTDLTQSGNLFTLRIEPEDKVVRFQLAGKDAARVKVSETQVEASYGLKGERKKLILERLKDPKSDKVTYVFRREKAQDLEDVELHIRGRGGVEEKFNIPKVP